MSSINKLSTELRTASRQRGRTAFVPFLKSVYELYARWRAKKRSQAKSKELAETYKIDLRHDSHPARIIIEASAKKAQVNLDPKTLSRFTACVRNAYRRRRNWTDFEEFLANNGGIAGVASLKTGLGRYKRKKI
jgi:hypothetical protein